jgi:osmotically-inducible protein OsmY
MKMTSKLNYALLGAALLVLSGYSAAQTPLEASTTDSVIVTGPRSTDSEIRAEVIKRIDEKPALRTENIDVQSFEHNVYLYGSVTSRTDGEEADAIARTVPGVKNVHNGLGSFGA